MIQALQSTFDIQIQLFSEFFDKILENDGTISMYQGDTGYVDVNGLNPEKNYNVSQIIYKIIQFTYIFHFVQKNATTVLLRQLIN